MGLNNDDIKQLIAILQRGLTQDVETIEEDIEVIEKPKKTRKKKERIAKVSKSKRINRFDQMPESRMHKEDVAIDRKLQKSPPTPRRDEFKPLKIPCRVCGKTESVDPSMIESADRYKCNKCAISAG
jgi:hypothetical protein